MGGSVCMTEVLSYGQWDSDDRHYSLIEGLEQYIHWLDCMNTSVVCKNQCSDTERP